MIKYMKNLRRPTKQEKAAVKLLTEEEIQARDLRQKLLAEAKVEIEVKLKPQKVKVVHHEYECLCTTEEEPECAWTQLVKPPKGRPKSLMVKYFHCAMGKQW